MQLLHSYGTPIRWKRIGSSEPAASNAFEYHSGLQTTKGWLGVDWKMFALEQNDQ